MLRRPAPHTPASGGREAVRDGARRPLPRQSAAHQRPANDNISASTLRLARVIVAVGAIAAMALVILALLRLA